MNHRPSSYFPAFLGIRVELTRTAYDGLCNRLNTGKYAEEHCDGMFDGSDHTATDGDKGTSNDAFDIGTGEL